ncbi:MAG: hypothetical protein J07HQW1_01327 [Haloquadratum walsbyi J07HQW1]|uniref:Uncharacterized protein n=1 Tax=Haloquadratum walsbyi J07HQW1 TaxID=1238424 RepID=U1N4H0_9EURY|nr:MAG: hypothetical protein J07HQW1_01327 [Haloquadratum walsbyi J07HQW1]
MTIYANENLRYHFDYSFEHVYIFILWFSLESMNPVSQLTALRDRRRHYRLHNYASYSC